MALFKKKNNITPKMRKKMLISRRLNILKRYAIIQEMTKEHYEEGNQRKCKRQAYRNHVNKLYPMSERAFYNVMSTNVEKEIENLENQTKIDFK